MDVLNTTVATATFDQWVFVVVCCIPAETTVISCFRIILVLFFANIIKLLLFITIILLFICRHLQVDIALAHSLELIRRIFYLLLGLIVVLVCAALIRKLLKV